MICLLDVNALIALGFTSHKFHDRVATWIRAENYPALATCSITELGFIRVLAQPAGYGVPVVDAKTLLLDLKKNTKASHSFFADAQEASHLPAWVKSPKQVTDGHLLQLAHANGAVLATLDEGIPGAHLIP